jgi:membrane dipeptidase
MIFKQTLAVAAVTITLLNTASAQTSGASKNLAQAREILREVPIIDGHNDIPWQYRKKGNDLAAIDLRDTTKLSPPLATDFPRLKSGGVGAQFWAAYIPATMSGSVAIRAVLEQIDVVHQLCERYPDYLEFARTADDIERIHRKGKVASMIGIEGGHAIDNSLPMLRTMYRLGVRYMTLTHVKSLNWADAAGDAPKANGLSEFGEQVIGEMNRLGMLVDISHVSDDTMRATLKVTKAPVIFSHSSVRAFCDHPRNVPDDVIKMLPSNGGVLMVNFMPGYLTERGRKFDAAKDAEEDRLKIIHGDNSAKIDAELAQWEEKHPRPAPSTLKDVADHIDHVRKLAGIDYIGIGADYEGFSQPPPVGLEDVSCYPALLAELMDRGYSADDIKKIAGSNLLRVMRKAEAVAAEMQKQ